MQTKVNNGSKSNSVGEPQIVQHSPKPRGVWACEGAKINWSKIMPPSGFRVLPRRWVVERTFSWFGHSRRLSKDYKRLTAASEAMIYVVMTRLMLKRHDNRLSMCHRKARCDVFRQIFLVYMPALVYNI